ncbi:MAG: hypothetical protein GWO04_07640, partial [Actinobacteria bacterium]|nr:hypothetical protein [Actinomycetota bacterium]
SVSSDGIESWTLSGTAGTRIEIRTDGVDSFDSLLRLIAPDGDVLASDDDSGGGLDSAI